MRQNSPFEQTPYGFRWGGVGVARRFIRDGHRCAIQIKAENSNDCVTIIPGPKGCRLRVIVGSKTMVDRVRD